MAELTWQYELTRSSARGWDWGCDVAKERRGRMSRDSTQTAPMPLLAYVARTRCWNVALGTGQRLGDRILQGDWQGTKGDHDRVEIAVVLQQTDPVLPDGFSPLFSTAVIYNLSIYGHF